MDDFSAESENQQDNEASASNTRKRDRKPTLTPDERHERKIPRDRGYRKGKKEEGRVLEERIVALEEMNKEQQSDIDFLKEELSKITARADELARKLNDESENLKEVKMAKENLESDQMRQLQQKILNQEHRVENLDIPWDDLDRNKILEGFTENSDPLRSKTPGMVQGVCFITLIDIRLLHWLKSTKWQEKTNTLEEIKYMEEGIADLELAGLNIPWLKKMVAKDRDNLDMKEEIENTKAELKRLEEMQSKNAKDRKSLRQRFIREVFSK
ncbi:hypothetical protein PTKIN_Ptkin12aG0014800 [Pterospermum kingtungense]